MILNTGYGQVRVGKKMVMAHRVVYEKYKGPIPRGLHLDHLCRNTRCVNPDHLEPVSVSENVRRGLLTKANPDLAVQLRKMFAAGVTIVELAKFSGLNNGHISEILHGVYWADAGGPIVTADGRTYRSRKRRVSPEVIAKISALSGSGLPQREAAKKCGVSQNTVGRIWKDINNQTMKGNHVNTNNGASVNAADFAGTAQG